MKKLKVVTIQIIWLRLKYRETSSRFCLCCFIINVYICVLDKPAGVGSRHFIQKVHCQISDSFASSGKTILREKSTSGFQEYAEQFAYIDCKTSLPYFVFSF